MNWPVRATCSHADQGLCDGCPFRRVADRHREWQCKVCLSFYPATVKECGCEK